MAKQKVSELAHELSVSPKSLIHLLKQLDYPVVDADSLVEERVAKAVAQAVSEAMSDGSAAGTKQAAQPARPAQPRQPQRPAPSGSGVQASDRPAPQRGTTPTQGGADAQPSARPTQAPQQVVRPQPGGQGEERPLRAVQGASDQGHAEQRPARQDAQLPQSHVVADSQEAQPNRVVPTPGQVVPQSSRPDVSRPVQQTDNRQEGRVEAQPRPTASPDRAPRQDMGSDRGVDPRPVDGQAGAARPTPGP
ncbi:MAG: translation initiation factor IF-2 N-terminal domain-containing protein, partial [Bacillota bacterium]